VISDSVLAGSPTDDIFVGGRGTEKFESFPLSDPSANVRQLAGRKGEVWGAESSAPHAVYVDETDAVWLSDWGANAILRFDPNRQAVRAKGRVGEGTGVLSPVSRESGEPAAARRERANRKPAGRHRGSRCRSHNEPRR